jgi:parallel beta-helix repeat protein
MMLLEDMTMSKVTNRKTCLLMSLLSLATMCTAATGKIIYVDDDAIGVNNGSSWENAYVYLQDALADANSPEKPVLIRPAAPAMTVEIRVAQGIYMPDQGSIQTPGDREATFHLINGVTLKGGYAGFGEPDPDARDVELYETILSGDLNGDDIQIDDVEIVDLSNLRSRPTRVENSYNIVIGNGTDDSAVLDGFTITAGNANGSKDDPYKFKSGAGMNNFYGSPTVVNCTFSMNSAYGAGGMDNESGNPIVVNCTFNRNSGRGMINWHSSPTLTDCTFTGNSDSGIFNKHSSLTLTNCTFSENRSMFGGGICNEWPSVLNLTYCTFIRNSAELTGGGMDGGTAMLTNCAFIANEASEGGGMWSGASTLTNCTFIANKARNWGGGMWSDLNTVSHCTFSGNSAGICGGAIYIGLYSDLIITNCTLTGNSAPNGNALASDEFFRDPSYPSNVELTNCIVWGGGNEIWNDDGSSITISYSDIQGGQNGVHDPCNAIVWGQGNIEADPLFADPGHWANVNDLNIVIEPNNPSAIWVNGEYHLKSEAGRWDPVGENWLTDDVTSPCIDAGDPLTPVMYEPHPRGCFINMGAYGGTEQASKSPFNCLYEMCID